MGELCLNRAVKGNELQAPSPGSFPGLRCRDREERSIRPAGFPPSEDSPTASFLVAPPGKAFMAPPAASGPAFPQSGFDARTDGRVV